MWHAMGDKRNTLSVCWGRERKRQLGRSSCRCEDITIHCRNSIKKCKENVRINLKIIKWDDLSG